MPITVHGFFMEEPVRRTGRILMPVTGCGTSFAAVDEIISLKYRWFISRDERYKLYEKYVAISARGGLGPSSSGSAVLDEHNRLVGMHALGNGGSCGLAIPAMEINNLVTRMFRA